MPSYSKSTTPQPIPFAERALSTDYYMPLLKQLPFNTYTHTPSTLGKDQNQLKARINALLYGAWPAIQKSDEESWASVKGCLHTRQSPLMLSQDIANLQQNYSILGRVQCLMHANRLFSPFQSVLFPLIYHQWVAPGLCNSQLAGQR